MLPPFIIAVGSRVRVMRAADVLSLKEPVFIDREAHDKVGTNAFGRVSMLAGICDSERPFPLLVVETQMGCPATQIILKEILYYAKDNSYAFDSASMETDGIYVVRAGTCAGVNSHSSSELRVNIGDILIANESYGSIGAVAQSVLGELSFTGVNISEKVNTLRLMLSDHHALGLSFDQKNIVTASSPRLIMRLQEAASGLGIRTIHSSNFSKDSLYAEMGEDAFAWLRDNYGVVSTEMEQLVIDTLAGEFRGVGINVYSGLVSAAIGAIPGKSFPETEEERKAADDAETNALRIAAKALGNIAKALNGHGKQ